MACMQGKQMCKTGNGGRSRAEPALKFKPLMSAGEERESHGRPDTFVQ